MLISSFLALQTAGAQDLSIGSMEQRPARDVLIKYEGQRSDSKFKHGKFKLYYQGNLQVKGEYSRNRKNGVWERYDMDRKLVATGSYIDGQKQGKWTYYFPNGKVRAEMEFERGMRTGTWKGYYYDGSRACELNFLRDWPIGKLQYWYPNGKLAESSKIERPNDSTTIVRATRYYENGKPFEIGKWINDRPDSVYKSFHDNTLQWEEVVYENGLLVEIKLMRSRERVDMHRGNMINGSGEARFYHADGMLYSIEQYRKGKLDGPAEYYWDRAKRIEGFWRKNRQVGSWKYFNKYHKQTKERNYYDGTGEVFERVLRGVEGGERSEGPLLEGLKHGEWTTFDFYGDVVSRTNYKFGMRHGSYRKYSGVVVREKGGYHYDEPVGLWQYYNGQGREIFSERFTKAVQFDTTMLELHYDPLPWKKMVLWNFNPLESEVGFIYGDAAENLFITENMQMPEQAKTNNVSGEVIVQLTIDEIGEVVDAQVMRGIGFGCDEEALRLVRAMPWRNPRIEAGVPVKTRINQVIRFQ